VDNLLAGGWRRRRETKGVEGRLAVVDSSFRRKSEQNVLVDEPWVVGYRRDVALADTDLPRPRSQKVLAGNGSERFNQAVSGGPTGALDDELSVEATEVGDGVHVGRCIGALVVMSTSDLTGTQGDLREEGPKGRDAAKGFRVDQLVRCIHRQSAPSELTFRDWSTDRPEQDVP